MLLLLAAVCCWLLLAAAPPRPNTAFVAWPWPRGTGQRKDWGSVLQPVIGAIMFVVVTQRSRVAANRLRSSAPEPISGPLLALLLSQISGAGRCACCSGFCPATDTRHTHARANAHGLALIHVVSTTDQSLLGVRVQGGMEGGQNQKGGPSSKWPRPPVIETGLGSPDIDRSVFPVLPASVPHMPLKKIGPMCMCHRLLLFTCRYSICQDALPHPYICTHCLIVGDRVAGWCTQRPRRPVNL